MPKIIPPTIGRRVWYWPGTNDKVSMVHHQTEPPQPFDAGVVFVHDDRRVNLQVSDHIGCIHTRLSVPLVQPGDPTPEGAHATWMPYQIGQAKG